MRILPFILRTWAAIALPLLVAPAASAAEPVRIIGIYVQPYYEAAATPDASPMVAVGESFSGLLASTKREDIVAARDRVMAAPDLVTPMTMMVLAIRLYDFGLRDDAAFWFYAAKDRYLSLAGVIDIPAAGLLQVEDAVGSFVELAGPFINGYAFCDIANQTRLRAEALAWVEAHPYAVIDMAKLPALPGGRAANLARSIARLKEDADKEARYFDDPAKRAEFMATRKANDMDAKFCWK